MVLGGEWSRRSRVKLRRTRVLFETFLDNSPGAEYLKDENGTYVYANKTNKTRFASDFVGKTDFEIFSSGYARCCAAIAAHDRPRIAYIGDRAYELDFARRLGAQPFDVTELDRPGRGTGRD